MQRWRDRGERQRDRGEKKRDRADNKNPKQSWVAQLVTYNSLLCTSHDFVPANTSVPVL